jgi:DUF971 family protein
LSGLRSTVVKPPFVRRRWIERVRATILVQMERPTNAFTSGREYVMPTRVHADRSAGTIELEWPDGHITTYDFETLRWLCPCAYCRGEAGIPGWLDSNPTLTQAQVQLTDLALVGNYALQPTWADGHHTGFYTFARLREECPCEQDTARRKAEKRAHEGHDHQARLG